LVTRAESITASTRPVVSSKSSMAPCTLGRPRAALPAITVTDFTATPSPSIQAARESSVSGPRVTNWSEISAGGPRCPSASVSARRFQSSRGSTVSAVR
jgi:hypothetical protein